MTTSLEKETADFLEKTCFPHVNECTSHDKLDFSLKSYGLYLDVKEKRQKMALQNWGNPSMPEPYAFILDDLAVRKIALNGPLSGCIIRDNLNTRYFWFSMLDLLTIPRTRFNRQMDASVKGKWLIDLRHASGKSTTLPGIFECVIEYATKPRKDFLQTACYGVYTGENIPMGGITRKAFHRQHDYAATR